MPALELGWIDGTYAICRLDPAADVPAWAERRDGRLVSVTRTALELSIVVEARHAPADATASRGWRAMAVEGTLDFGLTGILARLTTALAEARVPVFAISTYDTDVLLVQVSDAEAAVEALATVADVTRLRASSP
ncbi:MAG: ACT domain-containing protein [Planctomycetota bacterium]|jgi:hypothetical protein